MPISQRKIDAYLDAKRERDSYARAFAEEYLGLTPPAWKLENPGRYAALMQAEAEMKIAYSKLTGSEIATMRRQTNPVVACDDHDVCQQGPCKAPYAHP